MHFIHDTITENKINTSFSHVVNTSDVFKKFMKKIIKQIENGLFIIPEFMESMHDNQHAMQMMQGNKKMMSSMMQGEGMQMMMKDSTMMHSMMSEDCMESCSKMMGEKGMDMQGMDKMDDMDSPTKGEHTEHH